jgi:murein L,D-transpeptidase YafK
MGIVHPSGSIQLIRAACFRVPGLRLLMSLVLLAGALALGGCFGQVGYDLPSRAMKDLSPEMLALLQKKQMPKDSPILVRIFKEESELEVWKVDDTGRYALLKVYPICRWSGQLGPKVKEGDRQAPEGFYDITPGLMNPNSNYYLAINTGFPNTYDRANNRHGAFLMIHGDCSSRGCYAMTDKEIGEIFSLARDAFLGGQKSFQIQAYPFRMTPANLARHRNNPNLAFWRMIKQGYDDFKVSHLQPKVDVCARHYVFDAVPVGSSRKPLVFRPTEACPKYQLDPTIAQAVQAKERHDDLIYAQLVKENTPEAPLNTGTDGGMNRVFIAKLSNETYTYDNSGHLHVPPQQPGRLPPAISPPPGSESDTTAAIAEPPGNDGSRLSSFFSGLFASGATTDPDGADSGATPNQRSGFFGGPNTTLPASVAAAPTPAATTPELKRTATRTTAPHARMVEHESASAAGLKPKREPVAPKLKPREAEAATPRPEPEAKAEIKPEEQAKAAAPALESPGLINGAQPVVPAGTFDSRWAGFGG